jgi:hypothetical protein
LDKKIIEASGNQRPKSLGFLGLKIKRWIISE